MSNLATLKPPIEKGEKRGYRGRAPGVLNRTTRAMKLASIQAAELSKHSADGTLTSYLKFLADEHPPQFANILCRLIPAQMKMEVQQAPPRELDINMSLSDMMTAFEEKIRSDYQPAPRVIEHERDDDGE